MSEGKEKVHLGLKGCWEIAERDASSKGFVAVPFDRDRWTAAVELLAEWLSDP